MKILSKTINEEREEQQKRMQKQINQVKRQHKAINKIEEDIMRILKEEDKRPKPKSSHKYEDQKHCINMKSQCKVICANFERLQRKNNRKKKGKYLEQVLR